jgi:hypothetical protein
MRCQTGDLVRVYGIAGVYVVHPSESTWGDFKAVDGAKRFLAYDVQVCEINGQSVPCLQTPCVPPAADYPHRPSFGPAVPKVIAEMAVACWEQSRGTRKVGMGRA